MRLLLLGPALVLGMTVLCFGFAYIMGTLETIIETTNEGVTKQHDR